MQQRFQKWTAGLCLALLLLSGSVFAQTRTQSRQSREIPSAPATLESLREELDYIFDDPSFANAYWGVSIRSLDNSQLIYARDEYKGLMPASNMKIYSTAAALLLLGPDFRYETKLYSTDPNPRDGVIRGDLYVLGSGDPSFAARFHKGNPLAPLQAWAKELKSKGIRRIEGNIVGDDDVFDEVGAHSSWNYGYLSSWYAAESAGLCLNDNCYDVFVSPGNAVGQIAKVRSIPPAVYGDFVIGAKTTERGSRSNITVHRRLDTNIFDIKGTVPMGSSESKFYVTVHNPTHFFVTVLKDVLENAGIEVAGKPYDIDDLDKSQFDLSSMKLMATYQSPPLMEIIQAVNKPSQNLYADQLLRTLGYRFGSIGSFEEGAKVVQAFLENQGIDTTGFAMADGSGLSRNNLVTPHQTVALLETLYRHDYFSYFLESLPVAGVDGTIRSRMRGTRAEGQVYAKTGFINRVRCLSGYVTTLDGETLAFSLMTNNYTVPTSVANRLQDQVCERLSSLTRKKE